MTAAAGAEARFEAEDLQTRGLLRDLHAARPAIYWADLILTSGAGWVAFGVAARVPFSAGMLLSAAIAVFAFYRGVSFLHEISHMNKRALPGFETAWNVLFGFPLLMPSFMYVGVHQAHHSLGSYGTSEDPEYLPFAQSARMTAVFALQSFLIPAMLLLRFLVLSPAGLVIPPFQRWLAAHASAVTMNFAYVREVTPGLLRRIRVGSALTLLVWVTAILLLPFHVFVLWFGVLGVVSFINTLRTLAAHRYECHGEPMDRSGQLLDSVGVPGGILTELWAPVGLRYHALHHYFPGIPYHNLAEAHRRLVDALPDDSVYRATISPGLLASLVALIGGRTVR